MNEIPTNSLVIFPFPLPSPRASYNTQKYLDSGQFIFKTSWTPNPAPSPSKLQHKWFLWNHKVKETKLYITYDIFSRNSYYFSFLKFMPSTQSTQIGKTDPFLLSYHSGSTEYPYFVGPVKTETKKVSAYIKFKFWITLLCQMTFFPFGLKASSNSDTIKYNNQSMVTMYDKNLLICILACKSIFWHVMKVHFLTHFPWEKLLIFVFKRKHLLPNI